MLILNELSSAELFLISICEGKFCIRFRWQLAWIIQLIGKTAVIFSKVRVRSHRTKAKAKAKKSEKDLRIRWQTPKKIFVFAWCEWTLTLADLREALGTRPPPPSKFFLLHAVLRNIWQNCMLAAPWRVVAPTPGKSWIRHCLIASNMHFIPYNGFGYSEHQVTNNLLSRAFLSIKLLVVSGMQCIMGPTISLDHNLRSFAQRVKIIELCVFCRKCLWRSRSQRNSQDTNCTFMEKGIPCF